MTAKRYQENMLRDEEIEESPKTHWAIDLLAKRPTARHWKNAKRVA